MKFLWKSHQNTKKYLYLSLRLHKKFMKIKSSHKYKKLLRLLIDSLTSQFSLNMLLLREKSISIQ